MEFCFIKLIISKVDVSYKCAFRGLWILEISLLKFVSFLMFAVTYFFLKEEEFGSKTFNYTGIMARTSSRAGLELTSEQIKWNRKYARYDLLTKPCHITKITGYSLSLNACLGALFRFLIISTHSYGCAWIMLEYL